MGNRQVILQQNEQEVALARHNVRAACPKDKLEFKFLLALRGAQFFT